MATTPRQQPSYEGNAYLIIRQALDDRTLLAQLVPTISEAGGQTLAEFGIPQEEWAEFQRILNLLATGKALQDPVLKQIQEITLQQQVETTKQQFELVKTQLTQQLNFVKGGQTRLDETMDVVKAMKSGLKSTMAQIDHAFTYTMWMYIVSFFMGIALIAAAIWSAWYGKNLLSIVLGGFGTANTLTFFFTRPPERLQSSRASLAQLQIALLAWFNDFFNQNILLAQEASIQRKPGESGTSSMLAISDVIIHHTEKMMVMLQKYCKLVEAPLEPEHRRDKKKDQEKAAVAQATAARDLSHADGTPAQS
jgi:hypothetical protein